MNTVAETITAVALFSAKALAGFVVTATLTTGGIAAFDVDTHAAVVDAVAVSIEDSIASVAPQMTETPGKQEVVEFHFQDATTEEAAVMVQEILELQADGATVVAR